MSSILKYQLSVNSHFFGFDPHYFQMNARHLFDIISEPVNTKSARSVPCVVINLNRVIINRTTLFLRHIRTYLFLVKSATPIDD